MKTKLALILLAAAALLPACSTTQTAQDANTTSSRYANNSEPAPPAEGPAEDIPAEGPRDVNANPAYVPTPLLRRSAASQP
jgi:ABC-type glycerol-3-phosphate transport system substrate-binding protein